MIKHSATDAAILGCAMTLAACDSEPLAGFESETICYRGQVVMAEKVAGGYLVDFDLEVTAQERWCPGEERPRPLSAPNLSTLARRAPADPGPVWNTSIYGDYWQDGTVPYVIDPAFTMAQRDAIVAAMGDWRNVAPALNFREKTGSDTSWVSFVLTSGTCSSGYGRIAGARTVKLTGACTTQFSVHHEIGHALGLQHEHTRADRDDYLTVSSVGADYLIDSGADLFDYDFDSVMHYQLGGILALAPGVIVPPGVTVGQRNHLSDNDAAAMRAMYPSAAVHSPLFSNTGLQRLCRLHGREEDIENQFETISAQPGLASGEFADTNTLPNGDYPVGCAIETLFWSRDYKYPNSTFFEEIDASNANQVQHYGATATVRVLSAGLIPILL